MLVYCLYSLFWDLRPLFWAPWRSRYTKTLNYHVAASQNPGPQFSPHRKSHFGKAPSPKKAGHRQPSCASRRRRPGRGWLSGPRLRVDHAVAGAPGLEVARRLPGPQLAGSWDLLCAYDGAYRPTYNFGYIRMIEESMSGLFKSPAPSRSLGDATADWALCRGFASGKQVQRWA